ncbi:bifunctional sugar-binding transcriptional regulator/dihydroxyacetone kinase subunit DhaK [Paracoccus fistulariae]|uniref:Bifunctional sugar-binding transcriptional regulator/dihydroxyacetone kinase subunit DhaK n=1 Tax=Paracoccus fistulariae TaxID=658446 RepID=A0ABY7SLT4_9RHOB|nr:bifunctional sugar-binding transcriptional regulator/dihydroxyacetone kinase subunit DhaK [Paracoccus fistulariae]MDB6182650.1 bifunctional sugar-binding transcriptional regulator/dihydroxyacetone kinase subunit DhaK [Paracoccus fistulariae]WCR07854.1 bifunctional sugar-binding transcriptional regulator/dihydroxyacetone kinase subunit DhaK [Paracoccus fistulariae]
MGARGRTRDAAAPSDKRPPTRFGEDTLLWAAWLYYEEGLTQAEIATRMGVSRPSVNAYLADARTRDIVSIEIDPARFRALTLAQAMQDHFGLNDCLVIPSEGNDSPLIDRLGAAAAQLLGRLTKSGETISVTWGRTMLAMATRVSNGALRDVRVVQATGSTTAKIPWTPEACATRLAENLGARCIPLSAPAIVSAPQVRDMLLREPVLAEQMAVLAQADRIVFGVSSLRPESTIHTSGFFDAVSIRDHYHAAVGSIAGRMISATGARVDGPLEERTIGMDLDTIRKVPERLAVAGGMDKVQAILAALRGGYVTALVTDADTARAILNSEGYEDRPMRGPERPTEALPERTRVKKFLNRPRDAVDEAIAGALLAHEDRLVAVDGVPRAIRARQAPRPGKVGLVIGGGSGHEPGFLGYVGQGMADAVAVGNVFAAPPPDPILAATIAADGGAGVLHIFGNFSGDLMNFEMAAEMAEAKGIPVRTVVTTDDIASAPLDARSARRGVAGNVFVFKIAGAACNRMLSLDRCADLASRAAERCMTMGVALEPGASIDTGRPSFSLGPDAMEIGVGVHGEPGVTRTEVKSADETADLIVDRILDEIDLANGTEVALLVNSLGSTPQMELYILNRRLRRRLHAHDISVHVTLLGHYYTSLDMVGVSVTLMQLDPELKELLDDPCDSPAWTQI